MTASKEFTVEEILATKPVRKRKNSSTHPDSPHSYDLLLTPSGKKQFICTLPRCAHMLNVPGWIVGKETLCKNCYTARFIISEDMNLLCDNCRMIGENQVT